MAATGSPSHSQHQELDSKEDLQNHDPNPTESQEAEQSSPQQPPYSETLETPDLPNPHQVPLDHQPVHNSQQSDKDEDALLILDGDDQRLQQKKDHQSGTTRINLPEPTILTDDTNNAPPPPTLQPPLASPTNPQRRPNKRKKAPSRNPHKRKKVQNLSDIIKPIPFIPKKTFDFRRHEEVLKRLGLYDFSKIEFDHSIRTDLLTQLIVNYDSKKRCSYVNDLRIQVNRADLARALKLPATKQEKGSSSIEEVDLDSEVFSDESIAFIEDFVSNRMLLHNDSWVMPTEILNWTRCIKDGHPEKMDSASLIWYMVEKELTQGDKLIHCYYASHLQYLIRSQRDNIFEEDDDGVPDDGVADDCEEIVKAEEEKEEKEEKKEEKEEKEEKKEEKEEKTEEKEEKEETKEEKEETKEDKEEKKEEKEEKKEEKVPVVQEHDVELTLGPHIEEVVHEEVKKDDDEVMVDAGESKVAEEVEEQGGWFLDGKKVLGDHYLQRCHSNDLNNYEERKPEELEDEQIEQVEDEDEIEEEEGERGEEGFDMEANDDTLDRDGLTDNFLQGVETSHIPFGSQAELRGMPSMDLFGSRDNSFMSHGGPSFFGNGGKRVMETEDEIHHLDTNNKRLKTDETWDRKPTDFGTCMDQIHQLMEHAKMIHESKEHSFANSHYNQQLALNELQERQNIMEMIIKSKDEELEKKNTEVFRLERELYLMGDLLAGYRKALNDTRLRFSEYRERYALHEEPLYKDAGPGGLVLSTRELEKQRLKQKEDNAKLLMITKNLEEEFDYIFGMHENKVLMMVDQLAYVENELKKLKELSTHRKETRKPRDEPELSAVPEENQTSLNEKELSAEFEVNQTSLTEKELSAEPEANQTSLDEKELSAEPEANQTSLDEKELSAEPEANQTSLNEKELSAEPEANQTSLNEKELSAEPEANQTSLNEKEFSAKPEANQTSLNVQELLSAEPEANQTSLNDLELSAEPEENPKSENDRELSVEPEEKQKSPEEVRQNDVIMESVLLDADELKEKGGGEDRIDEKGC